jgi:broad specificity polyphosphatase/5'/3'-nucleotidase SurE
MVNIPKVNPELLASIKATSIERDAYMRSLYENQTPAQKKHRENYNRFMGVPEHEF